MNIPVDKVVDTRGLAGVAVVSDDEIYHKMRYTIEKYSLKYPG